MTVITVPVTNKKQFNDFINLPWDSHKNNPNWVPPLKLMVKQNLDVKNNPFYKHADLQCWIAYRDKKPVGRIAGILNKMHNQFHHEKLAFWGFFEVENNLATAKHLFHAVEEWANAKGMTILRGPANPSFNHECGLQISNFDSKPYFMMTQNPKYYQEIVEQLGHHKAKDMQAWLLDTQALTFHSRLKKKGDALRDAEGIVIRPINRRQYSKEVETLYEIYTEAWEKNWGFVPSSREEFFHLAKEMKSLLIPQSIWIVEVKGEPAAFGVFIPDLNQVLVKNRSGRLFPTGLLRLLWDTTINKKSINQGRIPLLGVKSKFRHLQLGALLYNNFAEKIPPLGYRFHECSWILEDNKPMQTGLHLMNAKHYKSYRVYDKPLGQNRHDHT